jgi:hypothetical protein
MSSDSSPYQPCASHSSAAASVNGVSRCWAYWPGRKGLSPVTAANLFASPGIVGDAYASTIATVWPLPVIPDRVTPYASRIWRWV